MKLHRSLVAILLPLSLGGTTHAGVGSGYLLHGVSPQEDALGRSALAAYGNPAAQWRNPAALSGSGLGLALSHEFGPLQGNTEHLSGALPAPLGGFYGVLGLQGYYRAEGDSYRDERGQEGSAFTNSDILAGLAYGLDLRVFSFGLGVKALGQTLAGQSASPGVLLDLGLTRAFFDQSVLVSLAFQNLGVVPQWEGSSSSSPSNLDLGFKESLLEGRRLRLFQSFKVLYPLVLGNSTTSTDSNGNTFTVSNGPSSSASTMLWGLGIEYELPLALPLALRAGYFGETGSPTLPYGLSAGLGMAWQGIEFNYAFTALGDLGLANRLSLAYAWRTVTEARERHEQNRALKKSNRAALLQARRAQKLTGGEEEEPGPPPPEGLEMLPSSLPVGSSEDLWQRIAQGKLALRRASADKGDLLFQLGSDHQAVGARRQALAYFKKSANAKNAKGAWAVGLMLYEQGSDRAALKYFELSLRLKPEQQEQRHWLDQWRYSLEQQ